MQGIYNEGDQNFYPMSVDEYFAMFNGDAKVRWSRVRRYIELIVTKRMHDFIYTPDTLDTTDKIDYANTERIFCMEICQSIKRDYEPIIEDFQEWNDRANLQEYKSKLFIEVNSRAKKMCEELIKNLSEMNESIQKLELEDYENVEQMKKFAYGVKYSDIERIVNRGFDTKACHFIIKRYIDLGDQAKDKVLKNLMGRREFSWAQKIFLRQQLISIETFMTPQEPPTPWIKKVLRGIKEFVENELKSASEGVPTIHLSEAWGAQSAFASQSLTKSLCTIL